MTISPKSATPTRSHLPAWRSPVYRTPLWIVAIVHFVRMLVWLVRFLARHPVPVLAVVVGVLMWRVTSWLGLVVLAVSIAAVLVVWWWRFPVSFSRFVAARLVGSGGPGTTGAAGPR